MGQCLFVLAEATSGGESACMKRLRRIMQPRSDGTHIVPDEILQKWNDTHGGGREAVVALWNASGVDKE